MTKGNEIEDLLFKYGRFIIFKFYENRYYKDTRWKSSFIKAKEILLEYNLMNPFILLLTTALIMECSLNTKSIEIRNKIMKKTMLTALNSLNISLQNLIDLYDLLSPRISKKIKIEDLKTELKDVDITAIKIKKRRFRKDVIIMTIILALKFYLKKLKWKKSNMVDFIFHIYCETGFEHYKVSSKDNSLRERIRQSYFIQ